MQQNYTIDLHFYLIMFQPVFTMCAAAAGGHTEPAHVCCHLQVLSCDVQRVFRLSHVKHLIFHILNVQLWVQSTVYPHLVDLPEEGVHICLHHSSKSGSEFG